jgi:hypothetical protein
MVSILRFFVFIKEEFGGGKPREAGMPPGFK